MTSDAEYKSNKARSLIFGGSSATVSTESKGGRLISRMNEDALAAIASTRRDLTPVMRRLGEYELHEEDYQQLHIWARNFTEDAYPVKAVDVADGLADIEVLEDYEDYLAISEETEREFSWLEHGRIKLAFFSWFSACKKMQQLDFTSVPALAVLGCNDVNLTKLDLKKTPELTWLSCSNNQITTLDLSNMPKLKKLFCGGNQLAKIDISKVPELTYLQCGVNQLSELDLSNVPELTELVCFENKLTQLNVISTPELTSLYCQNNQLSELQLSNLPKLNVLNCSYNELIKLDLAKLPELTHLYCHNNRLTELDVRKCRSWSEVRIKCDAAVSIIKNPDQKNIKVERV
ncbi:leucine-rich repeat domain-containing protein [Paracoccaceae bacterium]|nr:leucine-rich repeat domain-containing protein [Paracoccaceae bacterium]